MSLAIREPQVPAVPRRPRSAKATSRRAAEVAEKSKKVSFYLSPTALQRLGVHSAMLSEDRSGIVEKLILDNLKMFKVSTWGSRADEATPVESVDAAD